MPQLNINLLGPVEASVAGEPLRFRGSQPRAVLAMLALEPNRAVAGDRIVAGLWGDEPPPTAGKMLQGYVSQLRRLLGASASLNTRGPSYELRLEASAVDVWRFEQELKRAEGATGAARAESATGALALWRGDPLSDLRELPFAATERRRLEALRLTGQELALDGMLEAGRHNAALGELERLVREQPLRERLHELRMLALYRAGRQAAALDAYREARAALVDAVGVEPGPRLQRLHAAILAQDPGLDAAAPPAGAAGTLAGPLPAALERSHAGGLFVGRASELATLAEAWSGALRGQRAAVLVVGEPGIGKTRLAAEHARRAHRAGAIVLYGRCDADLVAPFGPLLDGLRALVNAADDDLLAAHARTHGGELSRLLPALSERAPDLPAPRAADPETERLRLHAAVVGLLDGAASRAPVLLILDDLHWTDRATLTVLLHVLRSPDARLLAVATCRDSELDHGPAFRSGQPDLVREPRVSRLEMVGITRDDTAALLGHALGRQADSPEVATLAGDVHAETDGNALYATELIRHLAATGAARIDTREGRSQLPANIPAIVGERLEQVGPTTADALRTATVIGSSFTLDVLAAATGHSEDELLDGLDRARHAGLVLEVDDEGGNYAFTHAVLRTAIAATLGAARRRILHRRVAEALAVPPAADAAQLGALAHHWIEAGSLERGREAATLAGDASLGLLAPDEAVRWYAQALALLERSEAETASERTELLIRLGEAERQAAVPGFREHLLEAGRLSAERVDTDRLARAALANNRWMHSTTGGVDRERTAQLETAIAALGDERSGRRALLLASLSTELWSADPARRVALSDDALTVARAAGDESVLAEVLYRRCMAIAAPTTTAERLTITAELTEVAHRLGDPLWQSLAALERARVAMEVGDYDEFIHSADRERVFATECGDQFAQIFCMWQDGAILLLNGRTDDAERSAERALQASIGPHPDAFAFYGAQLAMIRWDQGRLGELADALLAYLDNPAALGSHRALAAFALAEGGRLDEATTLIDRAVADGFALPLDAIWLVGSMLWGETCALAGHRAGAELLLERLRPYREQVGYTRLAIHGAAARVAAELAAVLDRGEAGELFELAGAMHERLHAPVLLARTHLGWGRWLLRRGQTARARTLIEQARREADAAGCAAIRAAAATPAAR